MDMNKFQAVIPVPSAASGAVTTGFLFANFSPVLPPGQGPLMAPATTPATDIQCSFQMSSPDSNFEFRQKTLLLSKLTEAELATMQAAFAIVALTQTDGRAQ
jgi:hypothetical protein